MANADELFRQANTRLAKFYICDIFNPKEKYHEAGMLYERAGHIYKLSRDFNKAADAYTKSAYCNKKLDNMNDAVNNYINALGCYKNFDKELAINCANTIIEIYRAQGCLDKIIKIKYQLIDLFEDTMDYDRLLAECKECLELLSINNNDRFGENSIKIKLANAYIRMGNYWDAALIYEKMAFEYSEGQDVPIKLALKYRAFDYIFNAAICYLADDAVLAERIMDKFLEINTSFIVSREYNCLNKIIIAFKNRKIDIFTNTIHEYNLFKPLMNWQIELLCHIKEKFNEYDLL